MKRWIVVAALGLATAGGIAAPGAAQASSAGWYKVYQANTSGSFYQTAAISKNNIWAVGRTYTAPGKTSYLPYIRHFNGSSWKAITIPHSSGSTADWVAASGPRNVWVGGLKNAVIASTVAYRWNGSRWAKIPIPARTDLQGVVVLAPNNVWAYGTSGTVSYDVFHWNGSRWHSYFNTDHRLIFEGISASAANNVWVTGLALSGSKEVVAAYRWNGIAWHRVNMPHPVLNNAGPGVTVASRSNVWIGWDDNTASHALHWDGHRWRTVAVGSDADPLNIVPDGKGGYWFGAMAIMTAGKWTAEDLPAFNGGFSGVTRIPGTTSFLLSAGVQPGNSSIPKPTIFRFNL